MIVLDEYIFFYFNLDAFSLGSDVRSKLFLIGLLKAKGRSLSRHKAYKGVSKMLRNIISKFLKDESGATAIEYGLIAALVSVAAIGALGAMGQPRTPSFRVQLRRVVNPSPIQAP